MCTYIHTYMCAYIYTYIITQRMIMSIETYCSMFPMSCEAVKSNTIKSKGAYGNHQLKAGSSVSHEKRYT